MENNSSDRDGGSFLVKSFSAAGGLIGLGAGYGLPLILMDASFQQIFVQPATMITGGSAGFLAGNYLGIAWKSGFTAANKYFTGSDTKPPRNDQNPPQI